MRSCVTSLRLAAVRLEVVRLMAPGVCMMVIIRECRRGAQADQEIKFHITAL